MKTYEWTAKSHVNIHDVMFFAAFSIFCLDSLVFMAINHGLIMSLVEQFLVGNLAEELEELNKLIAQQREILSWNVSNNPGKPWIALNLIQRLDGLESQKMQLVGWQEELLWTEASLNSILRQ